MWNGSLVEPYDKVVKLFEQPNLKYFKTVAYENNHERTTHITYYTKHFIINQRYNGQPTYSFFKLYEIELPFASLISLKYVVNSVGCSDVSNLIKIFKEEPQLFTFPKDEIKTITPDFIEVKTELKEEFKDETNIEIFKLACDNGQTEIVNLLLQNNKVEPNLQDNYALRTVCKNGFTSIVKLLLDTNDVEPDSDNNYCIKIASNLGYTEIVSLLLDTNKVDINVDSNYPLNIATENFHYEIVKLLTDYQQRNVKDDTLLLDLSFTEDKKYKKSRIPKVIKDGIWDYYIGNDVASVKCPCCQNKVITMRDFVAGHILSERNGGTITIDNLIPICSKCNSSMGTRHLVEFTQTHWNRKPVLLKNLI